MSKVRFELNKEGVRELMQSKEMMNVCGQYASNALSRLGTGYSSSRFVGKNRVNVSIRADSKSAKKENSANNTILKAVGAK